MGMIRDCQMVSSRDGTSEVMSGLIRLLSSQYHDVCSADSQRLRPGSAPPQMADVACASVPASAAPRVTARAYHVRQEQTQDRSLQQRYSIGVSSLICYCYCSQHRHRWYNDSVNLIACMSLRDMHKLLYTICDGARVPTADQWTERRVEQGSVATCEEAEGHQHNEDDEWEHQDLPQTALPPRLPQRLPVHLQCNAAHQ